MLGGLPLGIPLGADDGEKELDRYLMLLAGAAGVAAMCTVCIVCAWLSRLLPSFGAGTANRHQQLSQATDADELTMDGP